MASAEPALSPELEKKRAAASEVFRPLIGAFPKTTSFFHWEERIQPYKRFDRSSRERILAGAKEKAADFITTDGLRGFYLASDPAVSRLYSYLDLDFEAPYLLLQLDIPPSAKFLNLNVGEAEEKALREKLEGALGSKSCAEDFLNIMNQPTSAQSGDNDCLRVRRSVFRSLGVVGIRYNWSEPRVPSFCRGKDESAILIFNADWKALEEMKIFTPDRLEDRPQRYRIQQLLTNAPLEAEDHPYKKMESVSLWKDVVGTKPLDDASKAWAREHLLNCQEKVSNTKPESPPSAARADGK